MKLYLLSQSCNNNYDTYDSCLVCAESEADAVTIAPDGSVFNGLDWDGIDDVYDLDDIYDLEGSQDSYDAYISDVDNFQSWARRFESITCEEIGIANDKQKRGVVIASYNAG
jgi:hypothetical protein